MKKKLRYFAVPFLFIAMGGCVKNFSLSSVPATLAPVPAPIKDLKDEVPLLTTKKGPVPAFPTKNDLPAKLVIYSGISN